MVTIFVVVLLFAMARGSDVMATNQDVGENGEVMSILRTMQVKNIQLSLELLLEHSTSVHPTALKHSTYNIIILRRVFPLKLQIMQEVHNAAHRLTSS